jgi:hypothetical protein
MIRAVSMRGPCLVTAEEATSTCVIGGGFTDAAAAIACLKLAAIRLWLGVYESTPW